MSTIPIVSAAMAQALVALETAENGLKWYQDAYPDNDEAEADAMSEIANALAVLRSFTLPEPDPRIFQLLAGVLKHADKFLTGNEYPDEAGEHGGFACEAAMQYGFEMVDDDGSVYLCNARQVYALLSAMGFRNDSMKPFRQGNWEHPEKKGRIIGWLVPNEDIEKMGADAFVLPREIANALAKLRAQHASVSFQGGAVSGLGGLATALRREAQTVLNNCDRAGIDAQSAKTAEKYMAWAAAVDTATSFAPIPMVLHCPKCGMQHVDKPDPPVWLNEPHRSHKCGACEHTWRVADVTTTGVQAVTTSGVKDSPPLTGEPLTRRHLDGWMFTVESEGVAVVSRELGGMWVHRDKGPMANRLLYALAAKLAGMERSKPGSGDEVPS